MTLIDSKSCLCYWNKLVGEYRNSYHRSIGKKPIHANHSAFTEGLELIHKVPKFKIDDRISIRIFFSKSYTEKWLKEIYMIDSVSKTNQ